MSITNQFTVAEFKAMHETKTLKVVEGPNGVFMTDGFKGLGAVAKNIDLNAELQVIEFTDEESGDVGYLLCNKLSKSGSEESTKSQNSYYIFFDTETTGLPKNYSAPASDLSNWPRLVQLAYLCYDKNGNKISDGNYIIKPVGFTIPQNASDVHGITTEVALKEGHSLDTILKKFNSLLSEASVLIAHNISYDEKIIGAEFIRLGINNKLNNIKKICTKVESTEYCAISNSYGYKWPTLDELHNKLFGASFDNAHDAVADIEATAKCFWELKKLGVIRVQ